MKANVVMAPVNWRLAGPEIAFIVEDCKAPVLFVGPEFIDAGPRDPGAIARRAHHHRTEGGAPGWLDFAAWRDAQSGDDPQVKIEPAGHRDPALHLRHDGQAQGRDAVACQFPQPGGDRPATRSPTGTNGTQDDVSLVAMPIFHIGGSGWGVMGALSRRQGRDRAGIRSDQSAGFLRAIRHHQTVHGAGRDAVRGAAAARARSGFFAAEIHALWRLADPGGAAEGMHRGVQAAASCRCTA